LSQKWGQVHSRNCSSRSSGILMAYLFSNYNYGHFLSPVA
jgi:hypothetical protein